MPIQGKEVILYENNLYFIVSQFREPESSEELSKIKSKTIHDIVLRKNEMIYLGLKIDDAEVLEEWVANESVIESLVSEFLQKKEIKKIEELDNYIVEINADPMIHLSPVILRKFFTEKLTENVDAIQQAT